MNSLEALERVKKAHYVAMVFLGVEQKDAKTFEEINVIEKELKALEIIKRKIKEGFYVWDDMLGCICGELTKNEYSILKEVLYGNKLKLKNKEKKK